MLSTILAIIALLLVVASIAGHAPLWAAVLVLCILALVGGFVIRPKQP